MESNRQRLGLMVKIFPNISVTIATSCSKSVNVGSSKEGPPSKLFSGFALL